jgi:hypothetical protein
MKEMGWKDKMKRKERKTGKHKYIKETVGFFPGIQLTERA